MKKTETREKIYNLINTGDRANIEMAFAIDKSLNLGVTRKYLEWFGAFCINQRLESHLDKQKSYTDSLIDLLCCTNVHLLENDKNKRLPMFLLKHPNLKRLSITKSELHKKPKLMLDITKLSNLESLILKKNGLKTLPNELGNLKNLKVIELNCNKFKEFPKVLLKMKSLEQIHIQNNNISKLPQEITELTNLKALATHSNDIIISTELVSRIHKMPNIIYFQL